MGYKYSELFEVLEVGAEPSDWGTLRERMGLPDLPARGDDSPERLFQILQPTCQTVVVEHEYIDLNFRRGFARFHYQRHIDTPRRCKRLHLFARPLRKRDLTRLPASAERDYLGYIVVTPLPDYRIGRCILSDRLIPAREDLGEQYLTCKAHFPVNLAGNEIEVEGIPYMEQDRLVSACASASLWVVSWYMAHRYGPEFKTYFTCEITDMATLYALPTGRAMPSLGLSFEQMMEALRQMGFDPVSHSGTRLASRDVAQRVIYQYVESEIPPLLSLSFPRGGHAVAVVGHTFDRQRKPTLQELKLDEEHRLLHCSSSDFVPGFLVQDDAGGPFRHMELLSWEDAVDSDYLTEDVAALLRPDHACPAVFDRGTEAQEVAALRAVLAPLPPGVTLDGGLAVRRALHLLAGWFSLVGPAGTSAKPVLRTFLKLSNELKTSLKDQAGGSPRLRKLLRGHLLSRWVWVTEFSDVESVRTDSLSIGRVIQDSAGHPGPSEFDLLALHLPDFLNVTFPEGKSRIHWISDYRPYPAFERPHV